MKPKWRIIEKTPTGMTLRCGKCSKTCFAYVQTYTLWDRLTNRIKCAKGGIYQEWCKKHYQKSK